MPLDLLTKILMILGQLMLGYSVFALYAHLIASGTEQPARSHLRGDQQYAVVGIICIIVAFALGFF